MGDFYYAFSACISIHAPAKGAPSGRSPKETCICISIHAPAKGATKAGGDVEAAIQFQSTLPRRERHFSGRPENLPISISIHAPAKGATSKITYFFSNIDFYLGNTNKLQYCSFHFTILLIIFLLLSMVRTPLPFYVRLPPAPAYIIRIPSAS